MRNSTILCPVKMEYGPEINMFVLKMMMKSDLEKNILKFHVPLQSCCCQHFLSTKNALRIHGK